MSVSSYCSTSENEAKIVRKKAGNWLKRMAGTTGLEPATSDVTGRRSNQLNYVPEGLENTSIKSY